MLTLRLRDLAPCPVVKVLGVGLTLGLLTASPVRALDDAQQLLSGGSSMGEGSIIFTSPGMSNQFGTDFPGTGLGSQAAQLRIPKGTLRDLRVSVTTQNVPSSGSATVTVRLNGADTLLTCSVNGTGYCTSTKSVSIPTGGLVALRVQNTFVGSGLAAYTYSLVYD